MVWILAVLIDVWWYLVLISKSLMKCDVEHLFIWLFDNCVSSLIRCLFISLAHLLIRLCVNCWVVRVLCMFWITDLYQICLLQIFSPTLWLAFSFSWQCLFAEEKFLILMKPRLSILSWILPLVLYLKSHHHAQSHIDFFQCYLLGVL